MRASRLLSILTTLQAKGQATAQSLAEACEVSVRTIYRDIDALSAAGVPVYAERGAEGGYRLLDGYRTRLNGLSREEAEALFLSGLPGPAAVMGMGTLLAAAELKLVAALPAELRRSAEAMRARFHLDAPAWFAELERPPVLQDLAAAVWRQRRAAMRYLRQGQEVERLIDPLGLVLKGGTWYLVAATGRGLRTYRVSRIGALQPTDEPFEAPDGFDLQAYWRANAERFEESLYSSTARVRLSPDGQRLLRHLGRTRARCLDTASAPDADGWREVDLPMESVDEATSALLRFGGEAEVLDPPALRAAVAEAARAMHALYVG